MLPTGYLVVFITSQAHTLLPRVYLQPFIDVQPCWRRPNTTCTTSNRRRRPKTTCTAFHLSLLRCVRYSPSNLFPDQRRSSQPPRRAARFAFFTCCSIGWHRYRDRRRHALRVDGPHARSSIEAGTLTALQPGSLGVWYDHLSRRGHGDRSPIREASRLARPRFI